MLMTYGEHRVLITRVHAVVVAARRRARDPRANPGLTPVVSAALPVTPVAANCVHLVAAVATCCRGMSVTDAVTPGIRGHAGQATPERRRAAAGDSRVAIARAG